MCYRKSWPKQPIHCAYFLVFSSSTHLPILCCWKFLCAFLPLLPTFSFGHLCQIPLSALLIHSSPYFYASKCLHLFWQVTQAWFVIKLSDNHYCLVYPFFSPLLVSYGFFLLFVESSHSSFNSLRFHFSLECSWFLGMLILGFGCSFWVVSIHFHAWNMLSWW